MRALHLDGHRTDSGEQGAAAQNGLCDCPLSSHSAEDSFASPLSFTSIYNKDQLKQIRSSKQQSQTEMGVDQLAFNPSLRSLTHALGLDDDSIEEILSPNSIQRGSTGRPPSIASSIISEYDRSAGMPRSPESAQSMYRSPYSSAKTGHQIPEKKAADTDLRHLTCLQYCQVTGSNTCPSIAAAASEKPYERSCDDLSITSSRSNFKLQRNSTLRSHSVYLEPSQRHARNRSSCSLLSKVLPFGSRKDVSTSSNLAWSQCVPDVSIKDNAAHAAINAGLSGMPFADLILVSATDGLETHVHSYILSSVCPLLLQSECHAIAACRAPSMILIVLDLQR